MTDAPLKQLPLRNMHEAAGARSGAFAGWNMPLTYPLGVMKEHLFCRESAGLFDISHMKLFMAEGQAVNSMMARACPVDPSVLEAGESKYTFLLNQSAGMIDDLIITRFSQTRFLVVANASRADVDFECLNTVARLFGCTLTALDRVLLALQGPKSASVLTDAGLAGAELTFMRGLELPGGVIVTRSGYTGEDGFEISLPPDKAVSIARQISSDARVQWIGLAARDSLRLEAGLCLYGNDMDENTDPVSASLLWAIPKNIRKNGDFVGANALEKIVEQGTSSKRVGLKAEGRQPVRAGTELFSGSGELIGKITSGGFGPSVNHPVAMGYVTTAHAKSGTIVFAEIRGTRIPVTVHALPFTPHHFFRG